MNLFSSSIPGLVPALALGVLLTGCTIAPSAAEKQAHRQLARLGGTYRPAGSKPALPALTEKSSLADYLRFAMLNHPQVEAAYGDWRASVAAIAPARALPDPKLTFQADIADTLMSFMPGLMFDFMTPGKRAAMGREAAASSQVAYHTYVAAVLRTAAEVRKAWIELAYHEEVDLLYAVTIGAAGQALAFANVNYTTGQGMVNFEKQARWQNEAARHQAHHAALGDRLVAARVRFKSALGLAPGETDPPWPHPRLAATPLPPENELWRRILAANPGLAQMRAMVEMAVAGVEVARKSGTPDLALGLMADLKANPLMFRPTATLTLPVWRNRIASTIAAAEARRDAAGSRVSAGQLDLAAELAQMLYLMREADRTIAFIDGVAVPNYERTIATVEASYQSGMGSAEMIPETRLMILDLRHERAAMLREREIAATDLMLLTADVAPAGSPALAEPSAPPP